MMDESSECEELPPLTKENLEEEILGLREDLLNWDNGHPMMAEVEEEH